MYRNADWGGPLLCPGWMASTHWAGDMEAETEWQDGASADPWIEEPKGVGDTSNQGGQRWKTGLERGMAGPHEAMQALHKDVSSALRSSGRLFGILNWRVIWSYLFLVVIIKCLLHWGKTFLKQTVWTFIFFLFHRIPSFSFIVFLFSFCFFLPSLILLIFKFLPVPSRPHLFLPSSNSAWDIVWQRLF